MSLVCNNISTHTPLAKCDSVSNLFVARCIFQLTHLLQGVTWEFQLTHLAKCDRLADKSRYLDTGRISTHTPLMRCDKHGVLPDCYISISTHTPLAKCDAPYLLRCDCSPISTHIPFPGVTSHGKKVLLNNQFQLTHLLRGVTIRCYFRFFYNFNSHTSCEV